MDRIEETEASVSKRVREITEEVIGGSPLFIVDVDVRGRKGSQVVNLVLESDEALDVAMLARISREVEFLLDAEAVMPDKYTLNVSSPGLDRPLTMPRQYRKNVNRTLRVHFRKADGSGNAEVVGTLKAAEDDAIVVSSDGAEHRIAFGQIIWTKVVLPW